MTSHVGILLTLVTLGIGPIALHPATSGWAAQDAVHDHNHDAGAPAATTPGQSQAPAQPSADQMAKMRADRMSKMAAADDQLKTLMAEVNAAKTTDARVTAMTQEVADVFGAAIGEHPADWHMLQPLWLADLDPARTRRPVGSP